LIKHGNKSSWFEYEESRDNEIGHSPVEQATDVEEMVGGDDKEGQYVNSYKKPWKS
jgi:hypothetical protein